MAAQINIHINTLLDGMTQEQVLNTLVDSLSDHLNERQSRHLKNAVLLREETQSTYLSQGLAVPHGRTTVLDTIHVSVGLSKAGIPWPDQDHAAHIIIMLGVPTVMVTAYLTTLQKLLRWHKSAPLGTSGEWIGNNDQLLSSLQQVLQ